MHRTCEGKNMTMPSERTRAFIQTRDFLVELEQDPMLSASIRRQARQLLRQYPMQMRYCGPGSSKSEGSTALPSPS
ncbi:BPSL0761 family protein [Pseudomonas sp. BF-B-28]|uniref:BPSL0761 family protein n=1 Tax=Pseudomonas sp. BF-B-28 TaxID=2832353 RepID=UPI0029588F76|nr:BPSL0761 family protein [Pseudomonas sp. BF-B-28]